MQSILQAVRFPADLRRLPPGVLPQLADEIRAFRIDSVARTDGHLSSDLGSVELTIALHCVFDTPHDRIVWDVGHPSYPHKILTGHRDRMHLLRQLGGADHFFHEPQRSAHMHDFQHEALF